MGKTLRDEDLRLNIIINGDSGRKEMAALERSIHDTNAKLEALYAKRKKLEAQGKANTASYRAVQAQIGRYNKELDNNRAKLAALQRQQSINSMTLSELRAHINRVQIQLNKTDPKTPLWAKLNSELKASKQRLAEMSAQSKVTGGVVCNMAERINRYIGLITAGFASMTFAISGINRVRRIFQEYDEALNNMRKTTNLTATEAEELSRKLAGIDTRTAQNELMGIARVAGKLGIAKNDLFGFVKAADVLKISLGKDLGDNVEATLGQIGKLVTIFHLTEEFGIEEAMMKAGAAINELGKSSTANEANIVNFTKRVAGIAAPSKISIADITGLGATVDACGIQIETAGTAINNVITGMFKRTRQFAAVARMSFTDFRDLLKKDVNEALNRVLEGMSSTDGMEKVVAALSSLKIEGARSVTVLSSLANNTGLLREQQVISNQAFEEGTSCLGEFNIMNDTATARMEKAKKAVTDQAVALGRQLTPAITMSLSASTWFIRIMGGLVTVVTKYHALLIGLAVAYKAHTIAQKTMVAWDKLSAVWKQRNILFSNQYRIALTREAIAIHATSSAEKAASKSTMLWCAAKNLLVGNIRAATLAMKTFFASLGPVGWITLALSALGTVVGGLVTHYKNANKAQRLLSDNMKKAATDAAQERAELDRLKGKLESCRKGTKEYNDTKAEIISKFGKYDSTMKSETLTVSTLREKYDSLTAAIMQTARARQYNSFAAEQQKSFDEQFGEISGKLWEHLNDRYYTEKASKYYNQIISAFFGGRSLDAWLTTGSAKSKRLVRQLQELRTEQKKMDDEARARFGITPSAPAKSTGSTTPTSTPTDNPDEAMEGEGGFGDDGKWSLGSDEAYMAAQLDLKKRYLNKEIQSETEYNDLSLQLEITTLQNRLAKNIEKGEDRINLEQQLADKLLSQQKRNNQRQAEADEILAAAETDRIAQENKRYELQCQRFAGQTNVLAALARQHQRNITKIHLDEINRAIKIDEDAHERERRNLKSQQAAELLAFTGTASEKKRLKKQQAEELANVDMKYAVEMAARLKTLLDNGKYGGLSLDSAILSDEEKDKLQQKLLDVKEQLLSIGVTIENLNGGELNAVAGTKDILGFSLDDWSTLFENLEQGKIGVQEVAMALSAMANIYATYDKFATASENRQLKEFKKNNESKKKDLQRRFDMGLISQDEYNSKVEQLDEAYAAKEEEMQLKQARRQKALSVADAIINTAVGVTSALKLGPIIGPVLAAMIGAMGAVQIALITSQPITGAEEGGFHEVTRRQDGRKFRARLSPDKRGFVDDPTLLVGENGSEYIIPNEGLQNPTLLPFINTMEIARRNGTLRNLNFESVYPAATSPGLASGGFTSQPATNEENIQTIGNPSFDKIIERLDYLCERADDPIPAVVTLLGRNGFVKKYEEYLKLKNNGQLGR